MKGNLKSVQQHIKEGENIEAINSDDQTALHYAVSKNKLPIVEFLLEKGAKLSKKTKMDIPHCSLQFRKVTNKLWKY